MRRKNFACAALLLFGTIAAALQAPAESAHLTSPTEAFGFAPGADRKLADWKELTAYYQKLAGESDRIRYQELGKTTEGRPFLALTISSPENLQHLEEYKSITRQLSDPRATSPEAAKALVARGKMILVVTCNVHSTEIASSQSAAEFAYRLANGNTPEIQDILNNVILVLVPSLNPDGEQLVADWYRKYLGTPYEGSSPVVLWNKYVGHDDNRDWYAFTQQESKLLVTGVLNVFHPQVLYDLHQMSPYGPRLFLPPWVDPIDPNVDPLLESSMNALGMNTALEVQQGGRKGVLVDGVYDLWSPARCYMCYHNTLRVLTESASANLASPIDIPFAKLDKGIGYDAKVRRWNFPDPWMGGTWRMSDIVDYQIAAFFSIARNAADYRERYLQNFYTIASHSLKPEDAPYAYVLPAEQRDRAATARLVNTLRLGEVEIERATAPFAAGGKQYASGSYIVPLAQPYGRWAKTLLEVQHYPEIAQYPGGPLQRPYDVTAQTLPMLFGVGADAVAQPFQASTEPVREDAAARGSVAGDGRHGYLFADQTNSSLYALFALLSKHVRAYRLTGAGYTPGAIYLPRQPGLEAALREVAGRFAVTVQPAASAPGGSALAVTLPRIALYQSWVPSMDEGWTRWIFDTNGIPYTRVVDADIRKGALGQRFDALVLPDNAPLAITEGSRGRGAESGPPVPPEYTGGLGPDGVASLHEFVSGGGTVIALNKASGVYAGKDTAAVTDMVEGVPAKNFYIPGSILSVTLDPANPIDFGMPATTPIFFEQSPVFKVSGEAKSAATYAGDHPLLSGWLLGGSYLAGKSALVEEPVGKGRLVLFGFRPQYRGQSEATYPLLFNALLLSSSRPAVLGKQ